MFACCVSSGEKHGAHLCWDARFCSYLDLRPPRESEDEGARVCVSVEASADEEKPGESRDREKSRFSWKSLFLMASKLAFRLEVLRPSFI